MKTGLACVMVTQVTVVSKLHNFRMHTDRPARRGPPHAFQKKYQIQSCGASRFLVYKKVNMIPLQKMQDMFMMLNDVHLESWLSTKIPLDKGKLFGLIFKPSYHNYLPQ
jgi:hypothetical protein